MNLAVGIPVQTIPFELSFKMKNMVMIAGQPYQASSSSSSTFPAVLQQPSPAVLQQPSLNATVVAFSGSLLNQESGVFNQGTEHIYFSTGAQPNDTMTTAGTMSLSEVILNSAPVGQINVQNNILGVGPSQRCPDFRTSALSKKISNLVCLLNLAVNWNWNTNVCYLIIDSK